MNENEVYDQDFEAAVEATREVGRHWLEVYNSDCRTYNMTWQEFFHMHGWDC